MLLYFLWCWNFSYGWTAAEGQQKVVVSLLSGPNKWYQEGTETFLLIHVGKQIFLRLLSPKRLSWISNHVLFFPHPFILIASFTLSPTPLPSTSMWTSQENTMHTFSLIKGLDTLPCPRRKAPFISPYWISLSVSVLFNFALQFVFITGQRKESAGNWDNGTRSLSVSPWAMIILGWSALPAQCSVLLLYHRRPPDSPQITHKRSWPFIFAKHWLKGQEPHRGQRLDRNAECVSAVFRWWVTGEGNQSLFFCAENKAKYADLTFVSMLTHK